MASVQMQLYGETRNALVEKYDLALLFQRCLLFVSYENKKPLNFAGMCSDSSNKDHFELQRKINLTQR